MKNVTTILVLLAAGGLYLAACSDEEPDEVEVYDPPEPKDKNDGNDSATNTGGSTGQDTGDDEIDQTCEGIGATCVINQSDCREMRGTVDEAHDCISGVCCMVEVTDTDLDGVCDGKCISYTECAGPGYTGWEMVANGTCGHGTVCCVESAPITDTGEPPTDTGAVQATDTGTGNPVDGGAQDAGDPAGSCAGQCMAGAVDCVMAGGTQDTAGICDGTMICCIL